jgi:hypothetical protein
MAGATLTTMRNRLRLALQDLSGSLWTDEKLNSHIDRAVRELSNRIPRERSSTVATTADSRTVTISSLTDLISIEGVEWPTGEFPRRFQPFELYAGTLTLTGPDLPDGTNCTVYWLSPHTLDAGTSTIPIHLEDLILTGAEAYALLDQVHPTPTPDAGSARAPSDHSARQGRMRLADFYDGLSRNGRRNRVRPAHLFTPANPVGSQSRDPGP